MNAPLTPTSGRDGVRAMLGRLFGRARSHRLAFAVERSRLENRESLAFSSAVQKSELPRLVPFHPWSAPHAAAGGGGVDLAHIAVNTSADASGPSTRTLELTLPAPQSVVVSQTSWPTASRTAAVALGWSGGRGEHIPVRIACSQSYSVGPLSPHSSTVRDGLAWFAQHIPLRRERLPAEEREGGQSTAREHLAAASGAEESDIQVVGIYPGVPLTLVRQMALAEGGQHLRLWLHAPEGRKRVRLWTLTLGRLRSSGRTVQTIAEDKMGEARKI